MSAQDWFSIGKWVLVAVPWVFSALLAFATWGAYSAAFNDSEAPDGSMADGMVAGPLFTLASIAFSCWATGMALK